MAVTRFIAVVFTLGILGITVDRAFAEGSDPQEKTILERLDNFGKNVVGAILPVEKPKESKSKGSATAAGNATSSRRNPMPDDFWDEEKNTPRAGSISSRNKSIKPSSAAAVDSSVVQYQDETLPMKPRVQSQAVKTIRQPVRRQGVEAPSAEPKKPSVAVETDASTTAAQSMVADETSVPTNQAVPANDTVPSNPTAATTAKPTGPALYQRMAGFRQSVFDADQPREVVSSQEMAPPRETVQPRAAATLPPAAGLPEEAAASAESARVVKSTPSRAAEPPKGDLSKPSVTTNVPRVAARQTVAQRITPVERPDKVSKGPSQESVAIPSAAYPDANSENDDAVLFSRKGPILGVETVGPRKIAVGKDSAYEVNIMNSGDTAAEEIVVFVSLPEWAEISATQPTVGNAQPAPPGSGNMVQWHLGCLNSKARERLLLRIIPRQSKAFDLAVRWEYKPIASQAMIEVQEPKLVLQLEGPREVLYGKKELYRLKIANQGTGPAENVAIMLMPTGVGENVAASHKLNALAAGDEKTLDVELTARQPGNLTIQVDVRADGGAHVEMVEDVLVRRAGLKMNVDAPKVQFVGMPAVYVVRVSNPGTAMAKNVQFSAALPPGAKYLSGIENSRADVKDGMLTWTLDELAPNVEQVFAVRCGLATAGFNRLEINVTADDDLNATVAAETRVESVASLVMDVKDPSEPVAVGEDAVYEVCVRNRGTREATGVEVLTYFSRGIEPIAAVGAPNRILSGQVIFSPIATIAPGAEVVLKVRAKATVAGNHVFRAEAHCQPLGARLVSEATNLYYGDAIVAQQPSNEQPAGELGANSPHTVNRSSPVDVTPNIPRK